MGLFLTTVSINVTINDLKGYTFVHPTVSYDLYERFTLHDIEKSADLQTAVTGGSVTIVDDYGNPVTDLTVTNVMQKSSYDANDDGKIDAAASQVESVNGQTGMVNVNEPTFVGTTGIIGAGEGAVPDDGTVATGLRVLHDDGTWSIPAGSGIGLGTVLGVSNTSGAFDISMDTGQLIKGTTGGAYVDLTANATANEIRIQNRVSASDFGFIAIDDDNTVRFQAGNFNNGRPSYSQTIYTESSVDIALYSNPFSKWGRFGIFNNDAAALTGLDFASYPVYAGIRDVIINTGVETVFAGGRGYTAKSNDGIYSNRYYLSKNHEAFELAIEHETVTVADKIATFQNKTGLVALTSDITGNTLAGTLAGGITTGAFDISIDNSQVIKSTTGDAVIDLSPGGVDDLIKISADEVDVNWNGSSFEVNAGSFLTQPAFSRIVVSPLISGFTMFKSNFLKVGELNVYYNDAVGVVTSTNLPNYPSTISSQNASINQSVINTSIISGIGIIAKTDNSAYANQYVFNTGLAGEMKLVHTPNAADFTATLKAETGIIAYESDLAIVFAGTTAVASVNNGLVPDDGTLATGTRLLLDDGTWTEMDTGTLEYAKRSSTSVQNITLTPSALTWETAIKTSAEVTWSGATPTRLTVVETDSYRLGAFIAINEPTESRAQHTIEIYVNGVASGKQRASGYIRNTGVSWDYWIYEVSTSPIDLTAGDYVEIFVQQNSGATYGPTGTYTSQFVGDKSEFWLERAKVRGAKGAKGNTGAGSNIIVQREDVLIGTVSDTINFEGSAVTSAIDEGANKTTVTFNDTTYLDSEIKTKYENNANTNAFTDSQVTDVSNNVTHSSSNGSDHAFIDQNVTTIGTPTFGNTFIKGQLLVDPLGSDTIPLSDIHVVRDFVGRTEIRIDNTTAVGGQTALILADGGDQEGIIEFDNTTDVMKIGGVDSTSNLELWADNTKAVEIGTTEMELFRPLILQNGTSINEISIDGTLAGNSDNAVPTEQAVKTYVDNKRITKISKAYTDFTAIATNESITLFTLTAGYALGKIIVKHSTAFAGTAITSYTLEIGIVGDTTKYLEAQDVFTAVGDTVIYGSENFSMENWGSGTIIQLTARSVGGNLNAGTAGAVDIYYEEIQIKGL